MKQTRSRKLHKKSVKRRNKSQKAGTSYHGPYIDENHVPSTLDRLANYWYYNLKILCIFAKNFKLYIIWKTSQ